MDRNELLHGLDESAGPCQCVSKDQGGVHWKNELEWMRLLLHCVGEHVEKPGKEGLSLGFDQHAIVTWLAVEFRIASSVVRHGRPSTERVTMDLEVLERYNLYWCKLKYSLAIATHIRCLFHQTSTVFRWVGCTRKPAKNQE